MDEGKIRYWGSSNASDDYIRRADAVCKVTAVQERYSMMARWNEEKFAMLEELGIGFAAYSPMANGFLSGKVQKAEAYEKGVDFRRCDIWLHGAGSAGSDWRGYAESSHAGA